MCYMGMCVNTTGLAIRLQKNDVCSPNPCLNNGQCFGVYNSSFYLCNCNSGYKGFKKNLNI